MLKYVFLLVSCGILASCGGGGGGGGGDTSGFGSIGYGSLTPTRSGADSKIQDFIKLSYLMVEEKDNFETINAKEMPQQEFILKGNIVTFYGGADENLGILGDTILKIDVTKASDHITGSAENFIVGSYSLTGTPEKKNLAVKAGDIFYTTQGALSAYGEVDPSGLTSLGFSGKLDVLENGQVLDSVTVSSDGIGSYVTFEGQRTYIGALATDVIPDANQDLALEGAATILWAK